MLQTTYIVADKNVFGLNITMENVHAVAIVNCIGNSENIGSSTSFTEALAGKEFVVNLSLRRVFQNKIHTLLIPEITKHAQYVLVSGNKVSFTLLPEMRLNLNFISQLLLDTTLFKLAFLNYFNSYDVL